MKKTNKLRLMFFRTVKCSYHTSHRGGGGLSLKTYKSINNDATQDIHGGRGEGPVGAVILILIL